MTPNPGGAMTELKCEILAALERSRITQQESTAELTAAIKQMPQVLATFADALLSMAESNREANQ
jgi:hypothetical protein